MFHGFSKTALVLVFIFGALSFTQKDDDWELAKSDEGIYIYKRKNAGSDFIAIKAVSSFNCSPPELLRQIKNISAHKQWIPNCIKSDVLKTINDSTLVYYEVYDSPWPAKDRDVVILMNIRPSATDGTITIESRSYENYLAKKEDYERIKDFKASWTMTAKPGNKTYGRYIISFDPGGNIPAWFINQFSTSGPYDSFTNLKKRI